MMDNRFQRWTKAGMQLVADPSAKVNCPDGDFTWLTVKDEQITRYDAFDRYLICDNCKKWAVISRIKNPEKT